MRPIYIVSAGRPHCTTAQTLERIGIRGFYIAVSDTDASLSEYLSMWGQERVLTYSYESEAQQTDLMDNFEDGVCGAAPARNGVIDIAKQRGDRWLWMLDDDFTAFTVPKEGSKSRETVKDPARMRRALEAVERFAESAGLTCAGGACDMQAFPPSKSDTLRYVRGMYLIDADKAPRFRSRMEEDLTFSADIHRDMGRVLALRALGFRTKDVCAEEGGCTTVYEKNGTVRRAAYNVLACPHTKVKEDRFGYSGFPQWERIVPKTVSERWKR